MLCAVCCVLITGCIHRSLTIRTEPSGALVYVNNQLKGKSPVTYDFKWYGGYHVVIRHKGYRPLEDHKMLRSPIYSWIPFDLITELLPFHFYDARTWSYTLEPEAPSPSFAPPPIPRIEDEMMEEMKDDMDFGLDDLLKPNTGVGVTPATESDPSSPTKQEPMTNPGVEP